MDMVSVLFLSFLFIFVAVGGGNSSPQNLLYIMFSPWLFLLLPLVLPWAIAQPLSTKKRTGSLENFGDEDVGFHPTIGGNLSAIPFSCSSPKTPLQSITLTSSTAVINSTIGCPLPAALTRFAAEASILKGVPFSELAEGSQGRSLYPVTKVPQEHLVWPTDINFGYTVPPANTPQSSELLSKPQQGQTPATYSQAGSQAPETPISGLTYSANSASKIVVEGQTIEPGAPTVTISGTSFSLVPNGGPAIISGSTQKLVLPTSPLVVPTLSFGGSTYTANSASQFIVAGEALNPGSQITVSGTPISLAAGGTIAVVGSSTQVLAPNTTPTGSAILTFAGSSYTADSSSGFLIDGQTLKPGGAITVQSNIISLNQGGSAAIIGGSSTQYLSTPYVTATPGAVITFGGSTYTLNSASDFEIGGQSLSEGGVITVGGTPISFAAGGTDVVVGTSTEGLGGENGLGNGPTGSATGVVGFQSGAKRVNRVERWSLALGAGFVALWEFLGVI